MSEPEQDAPTHVLLLGESEARYGEFAQASLASGRVSACLTVGSDPKSPSMQNKGDRSRPNEDALFAVESENRVFMAVADAHFGTFASHALLRAMADLSGGIPASPMDLARMARLAAQDAPEQDTRSATTLLMVVLRRDMSAGFGFSWGDSTCACVGGKHDGRRLNATNENYVNLSAPWGLTPDRAAFFEFDVKPGELVLAFTDGLDACHYENPLTSIGAAQLTQLFGEVGADPKVFARRATEWALTGRDGYPGGQDNLALIAAAT